jgi:hypothetical protein
MRRILAEKKGVRKKNEIIQPYFSTSEKYGVFCFGSMGQRV